MTLHGRELTGGTARPARRFGDGHYVINFANSSARRKPTQRIREVEIVRSGGTENAGTA